MRQSRHGHHGRHFMLNYPVATREKIYSVVLGPLLVFGVMWVLYSLIPHPSSSETVVPFSTLLSAVLTTLSRLLIAYILAVVCAIPLALLTTISPRVEAILLPIFDVLESVPILAVFPIVILLFINVGFLSGAAIFILFLNMLWNIVFAVVGGLKVIPRDITYAAHVFGIRGFQYVRKVVLPGVFPTLVTGSILALADGWNIVIVAEALHTYIPHGAASQDLFGIGSILVNAAANAQNSLFLSAVVVMVTTIAFVNFFVWQKLLHFAQRFRFE